jgi:TPR repeat protein
LAALNIAILYREKSNLRGELKWFFRAADKGDDGARIELAKHYLNGTGVDQSPEKALALLLEAKAGTLSGDEADEADDIIAKLRLDLKPISGV